MMNAQEVLFPLDARVQVKAYGYGARLADCGRTGTVVGHGRTRVKVALDAGSDPAETRSLDVGELRRL